jgi:hypothetical protein
MGFPSTLIEFQERFPHEESCGRSLRGVCFITTRKLEPCRRCRYQAPVTAGTILQRTRRPFRIRFLGVFFLAAEGRGGPPGWPISRGSCQFPG